MGIAINCLGAGIPARDPAFEVVTDDGVFGRLDDCRKLGAILLVLFVCRDVHESNDRTAYDIARVAIRANLHLIDFIGCDHLHFTLQWKERADHLSNISFEAIARELRDNVGDRSALVAITDIEDVQYRRRESLDAQFIVQEQRRNRCAFDQVGEVAVYLCQSFVARPVPH